MGVGGISLRLFGKRELTFVLWGRGQQMPFAAALVTLSPEDCSHWS